MSLDGFGDRLTHAVRRKGNAVCVGLDPRLAQLPPSLQVSPSSSLTEQANAYLRFCIEIIDVVHDKVPIVKPQSAFFEELGPPGVTALANACQYASSKGLLVIMDAKRNDIGTTATAYANAYLGPSKESPFGCDALTVSPYLGSDSLQPFISRCHATGCGLFILVKTSNPGSGFLQDRLSEGVPVSQHVANYVQEQALATSSSSIAFGSIGAVVGATYPEQLAQMRASMPNAWLLIPGYGAQGGSAKEVVLGMDREGLGAIVNSSRGIIFAYENKKYSSATSWQHAVELATVDMIEAIRSERTNR